MWLRLLRGRLIITAMILIFSLIIITVREKPSNDFDKSIQEVEETEGIVLGIGSTITFKRYYTQCEHIEKWQEPSPLTIPGTRDIISGLYPEWSLKEFTKDGAVFVQTVDGYCNDHLFVGISENGYIALFKGSWYNRELIEESSILVNDLRQEDVILLERGIHIDNYEEYKEICQDLST